MKKIILSALISLTLLSTLACTKLQRDNPFDPGASSTILIDDKFNSYPTFQHPGAPWITDGTSGILNLQTYTYPTPADQGIGFYLGGTVPAGSRFSLYQTKTGQIHNKILVEFSMTYIYNWTIVCRGAFELADKDGKIWIGFGMETEPSGDARFCVMNNSGAYDRRETIANLSSTYKCKLVIDLDTKKFTALVKNSSMANYLAIVQDANLPSDIPDSLERIQLSVYSPGTSAGGGTLFYMDNLTVSRFPK